MRQHDLVKRTRVDKGTISIELGNLRAQGLVERCTLPKDRRSIIVTLKEKGRLRIQLLEQRHQRLTHEIFNCLTGEENNAFHHLLTKLGDRLDSL